MKIVDSTVHLAASHEASYSRTTEMTSTTGFRQVFDSLVEAPADEAGETRRRLLMMLQSLINAMLAALDGKNGKTDGENFAVLDPLSKQDAPRQGGREIRWENRIVDTVKEYERTEVCGHGCVRTQDGRQIEFDVSLRLARDYERTATLVDSGTITLQDPLILSFDGNSAELSVSRISFDLDADGKAEAIPGLGKNCGFLVFDRNGNGKADDGRELFGVASGNGFADLSKLDDDRNGWIDDNDAVYKKLAVWSGDGLTSLAQRGVGALYTGVAEAPFTLKTADNALLGQIRAAGIYLTECGEVGHLQQVDLAVSSPADREYEPGERQRLTA